MRSPIALLVLLTLNLGSAFGQSQDFALLVTPTGFYRITQGPDGPVTTRITNVVVIGNPTNTPNDPPVIIPPPPSESELSKNVRAWASEVNDPVGRQALSLVAKTIHDSFRDGNLSNADVFPAFKQARTAVLASVGTAARWEPFFVKLTEDIKVRTQTGTLQNDADKRKWLLDVKAGLDSAAAENEPAVNVELLKKILEIIMLIISTFAAPDLQGGV